jgi:hypothetical protein
MGRIVDREIGRKELPAVYDDFHVINPRRQFESETRRELMAQPVDSLPDGTLESVHIPTMLV